MPLDLPTFTSYIPFKMPTSNYPHTKFNQNRFRFTYLHTYLAELERIVELPDNRTCPDLGPQTQNLQICGRTF